MDNDEPLAYDKLQDIRNWLEYMEGEVEAEALSLGEISDIDRVYDTIKEVTRDENN